MRSTAVIFSYIYKRDVHERVRKTVAKEQRHPFGAAKCMFLVRNFNREGVYGTHTLFLFFWENGGFGVSVMEDFRSVQPRNVKYSSFFLQYLN